MEYVEYISDKPIPITSGMLGEINILLPNGQYHVRIFNNKNEAIAYAPFSEEQLEAVS